MSVRVAVVMPDATMVVVEVAVSDVPGGTDPEDAAVRLADWARTRKGIGVRAVTRKGNRVRIDVDRLTTTQLGLML